MRLLSTSTLEFVEFFAPPDYAILSHRWSDQEVSYEDYQNGRNKHSLGYRKIVDCCTYARTRGLAYVWIDTCCIDKRSSAELSEAINSMWRWYANAKECYVHLADVIPQYRSPGSPWSTAISMQNSRPFNIARYRVSDWFSRGWTLQELLAPRVVIFCNRDWQTMGQKTDRLIINELVQITSIPEACLTSRFALNNACIAKKMSWAARRVTTRPEDIAYCLLGLVGVNMPLLYGEGHKAFQRLQHEIIRQTKDESIFAWRYPVPPADYSCGLLAEDIALFMHSGDVRALDRKRLPYSVTNQGLDLTADGEAINSTGVYIIPLNCEYGGTAATRPVHQVVIAVREERGRYSRVHVQGLGHHLSNLYPSVKRRSVAQKRFIVRLARWDTEYEPAAVVLKNLIAKAVKARYRGVGGHHARKRVERLEGVRGRNT